MITSTVKPSAAQSLDFPCLMQDSDGLIVLMTQVDLNTNEGSGTVIAEPYEKYEVGWQTNCWDFDSFKPFEGEIILKNSK
jgi:hypothetical protein